MSDRFQLHYADLADASSLSMVMEEIRPDEVYNLGAQSHVRVSFDQPLYTADVVGLGTLRILEATRHLHRSKPVKFYQASSSEMFGSAGPPQGIETPFHPRSPYACAKLYGHWQTINYREAYGMFACSGILFNHESPRRGESFVTRKITLGAARIKEGLQKKLVLGNLDAKRDWGFAGDYVRAMWLMLQQETPDDFVVATGETHSVREFLEDLACSHLGLEQPRTSSSSTPAISCPSEVARRPPRRLIEGEAGPRVGARGELSRAGEDDARPRYPKPCEAGEVRSGLSRPDLTLERRASPAPTIKDDLVPLPLDEIALPRPGQERGGPTRPSVQFSSPALTPVPAAYEAAVGPGREAGSLGRFVTGFSITVATDPGCRRLARFRYAPPASSAA